MHSEAIGLFGGTFDPPHVGHLILAAEARDQLDLARVLWVLTPQPPHKRGQPITPLAHRLAMLEAMLTDLPEFELSRIEIERPGPHYAIETVQAAAAQCPGAEITYIMGGDSLRDLPAWHRPADFLSACHTLGVMRRPSDQIDLDALERALPGIRAKTRFIEAPLLTIAASDIRRRIAGGKTFRYYLHPKVYEYIQQHHLYR
jgi:nicotinate-nucleotide adenylyltransferase